MANDKLIELNDLDTGKGTSFADKLSELQQGLDAASDLYKQIENMEKYFSGETLKTIQKLAEGGKKTEAQIEATKKMFEGANSPDKIIKNLVDNMKALGQNMAVVRKESQVYLTAYDKNATPDVQKMNKSNSILLKSVDENGTIYSNGAESADGLLMDWDVKKGLVLYQKQLGILNELGHQLSADANEATSLEGRATRIAAGVKRKTAGIGDAYRRTAKMINAAYQNMTAADRRDLYKEARLTGSVDKNNDIIAGNVPMTLAIQKLTQKGGPLGIIYQTYKGNHPRSSYSEVEKGVMQDVTMIVDLLAGGYSADKISKAKAIKNAGYDLDLIKDIKKSFDLAIKSGGSLSFAPQNSITHGQYNVRGPRGFFGTQLSGGSRKLSQSGNIGEPWQKNNLQKTIDAGLRLIGEGMDEEAEKNAPLYKAFVINESDVKRIIDKFEKKERSAHKGISERELHDLVVEKYGNIYAAASEGSSFMSKDIQKNLDIRQSKSINVDAGDFEKERGEILRKLFNGRDFLSLSADEQNRVNKLALKALDPTAKSLIDGGLLDDNVVVQEIEKGVLQRITYSWRQAAEDGVKVVSEGRDVRNTITFVAQEFIEELWKQSKMDDWMAKNKANNKKPSSKEIADFKKKLDKDAKEVTVALGNEGFSVKRLPTYVPGVAQAMITKAIADGKKADDIASAFQKAFKKYGLKDGDFEIKGNSLLDKDMDVFGKYFKKAKKLNKDIVPEELLVDMFDSLSQVSGVDNPFEIVTDKDGKKSLGVKSMIDMLLPFAQHRNMDFSNPELKAETDGGWNLGGYKGRDAAIRAIHLSAASHGKATNDYSELTGLVTSMFENSSISKEEYKKYEDYLEYMAKVVGGAEGPVPGRDQVIELKDLFRGKDPKDLDETDYVDGKQKRASWDEGYYGKAVKKAIELAGAGGIDEFRKNNTRVFIRLPGGAILSAQDTDGKWKTGVANMLALPWMNGPKEGKVGSVDVVEDDLMVDASKFNSMIGGLLGVFYDTDGNLKQNVLDNNDALTVAGDFILDSIASAGRAVKGNHGDIFDAAHDSVSPSAHYGKARGIDKSYADQILRDYHNGTRNAWEADQALSGITVSKGSLKKMLTANGHGENHETEDQTLARLKGYYDYLKETYSSSSYFKNNPNDPKTISEYADRIADIVDVGRKGYQGESLQGFGLRYPLSSGQDIKFAHLYADSHQNDKEVLFGIGIASMINEDFDGDEVLAFLERFNPKDLEGLTPDQVTEKYKNAMKQAEDVRQDQSFKAQLVAKAKIKEIQEDQSKKTTDPGETEPLTNPQKLMQVALADRIAKMYTGRFSNQYQRFANAAFNAQKDETGLNPSGDNSDDIASIIVRGTLEAITQKAISSKKILKGDDFIKVWDSLETIYQGLGNPDTFNDTAKRKEFWNAMDKVGAMTVGKEAFEARVGLNIIGSMLETGTNNDPTVKWQERGGFKNTVAFLKKVGIVGDSKNATFKNEDEFAKILPKFDEKGIIDADYDTDDLNGLLKTSNVKRILNQLPKYWGSATRENGEAVLSGKQVLSELTSFINKLGDQESGQASLMRAFAYMKNNPGLMSTLSTVDAMNQAFGKEGGQIHTAQQGANGLLDLDDKAFKYAISVSKLSNMVFPHGINTDTRPFIKDVLNGKGGDYSEEKRRELLRSYQIPTEGTLSGAWAEILEQAKKDKIDIKGLTPEKLEEELDKNKRKYKELRKLYNGNPGEVGAEGFKNIYEEYRKVFEAAYGENSPLLENNPDQLKKILEMPLKRGEIQAGIYDKLTKDFKKSGFLTAEQQLYGLLPNGQLYGGRTDLSYFGLRKKGDEVNGRKLLEDQNVYGSIDTKNPQEKISAGNILQQLLYLNAERQLQKAVNDPSFENSGLYRQLGLNKDALKALKNADVFETQISTVNAGGRTQAYTISANANQLSGIMNIVDQALNGENANFDSSMTKRLVEQLASVSDIPVGQIPEEDFTDAFVSLKKKIDASKGGKEVYDDVIKQQKLKNEIRKLSLKSRQSTGAEKAYLEDKIEGKTKELDDLDKKLEQTLKDMGTTWEKFSTEYPEISEFLFGKGGTKENPGKGSFVSIQENYRKGLSEQSYLSSYENALRQEYKAHRQVYDIQSRLNSLGLSKEDRAALKLSLQELQEYDDALDSQVKKEREEAEAAGVSAKALDDKAAKYEKLKRMSDLNTDAKSKKNNTIWGSLDMTFTGMFNQLMRGGLAFKLVGKVRQGIQQITQSILQLNKALTDIQIVTGDTETETQNLLSGYSKLGKQIGATTLEVAHAANSWLRQGYSVSQVNDLVTSSLYLSKLGMIDSGQATEYMTSMLHGFKLEAEDAMEVVDKLTAVDMKAATSAGEIAQALQQFATTAQLSGVNMDEAVAMAATIQDVSQSGASTVGAALKTILSRFGNVKSGSFTSMEEGDGTKSLNDIETVLSKIDVRIRDSAYEMRDFDDVLEDVAKKWNTLDDVTKNALATAFAGVRQREAFLVLMENMDKYHDLLKTSEESSGTAIKKYESYSEQIEAAQKRLQAAWEDLVNNKEIQNLVKMFYRSAQWLVESLPAITRVFSIIARQRIIAEGPRILKALGQYSGLAGFINTAKDSFKQNGAKGTWKTVGQGIFGKFVANTGGKDLTLETNTKRIAQDVSKIRAAVTGEKLQGSGAPQVPDSSPQGSSDRLSYWKNAAQKENFTWENYQLARSDLKNGDVLGHGNKYYFADEPGGFTYNKKTGSFESDSGATIDSETLKQLQIAQAQRNIVKAGNLKAVSIGLQIGSQIVAGAVQGAITAKDYGTYTDAQGNKQQFALSDREKNQNKIIGATTGVLSAIPLIGPLASYAGDAIMDAVHKDSAEFAKKTAEAGEREKVYSSISNDATALNKLSKKSTWSSDEMEEVDNRIQNITDIMYAVDENGKDVNAGARNKFTKYLREILQNQTTLIEDSDSLYDITNKMSQNVSDQKVLAQAMLAAQFRAKREDLIASQGQTRADLEKQYAELAAKGDAAAGGDIKAYDKKNAGAGVVGGVIGGVAGAGAGAVVGGLAGAAGAAILGATAAIPVAGPIIAAITAVGLGITGAVLGAKQASAIEAEEQQKQAAANAESLDEKLARYQEYYENGDATQKAFWKDTIASIKEVQGAIQQQNDEYNKALTQEALAAATVDENNPLFAGETVSVLNNVQLQRLGPDAIVKAMAQYIEKNGGYEGQSLYTSDGELTTAARDYIESALRGDATLSGAFTGKSYTVSEAASLFGNRRRDGEKLGHYEEQILENFASALGVGIDELYKGSDAIKDFSDLTLGDLTSSVDELTGKIQNIGAAVSNLMDTSRSSIENYSMIMSQFPSLISYMGDTGALFEHLFNNTKELAQYQLKGVTNEILSNEKYYQNTILPGLNGDTEVAKIMQKNTNLTKAGTIGQLVEAATSAEGGEKVLDRLKEIVKNVTLVSDIRKQYVDILMKFPMAMLDKQLDNLKAQKEALQNINNQREYQNKLLEAQLNLENALKEKKRVWREGVGWVYEADQSAIDKAQKNLDNLDAEKQAAEVEAQINELEYQKELLSNIKENTELEKQKLAFDKWFGNDATNSIMSRKFSGITDVLTQMKDLLDPDGEFTTTLVKAIDKKQDSANEKHQEQLQKLTESYNNLQEKKKKYNDAKRAWDHNKSAKTLDEYNKAIGDLDSAQQQYQKDYNAAYESGALNGEGNQVVGKTTTTTVDSYGVSHSETTNITGNDAANEAKEISSGKGKVTSNYKKNYYAVVEDNTLHVMAANSDEIGSGSQTAKDMFNNMSRGRGRWWNGKTSGKISKEDMKNYDDLASYAQNLKNGIIQAWDFWNNCTFALVKNGRPYQLVEAAPHSYGYSYMDNRAWKLGEAEDPWESLTEENFKKDFGKDLGPILWKELNSSLKFYASGTLRAQGGPALLNELGTEAIVTPSGTLTSLPSSTGVVPADITKNLWQLGGLAPELTKFLEPMLSSYKLSPAGVSNTDDSFNVGVVNMTVNADSTFDPDAWVNAIKTQVQLSKNNRR